MFKNVTLRKATECSGRLWIVPEGYGTFLKGMEGYGIFRKVNSREYGRLLKSVEGSGRQCSDK